MFLCGLGGGGPGTGLHTALHTQAAAHLALVDCDEVGDGAGLAGRSGFDLSVSGRPPTSSEAAGPQKKTKQALFFSRYTAAFYVVGGPGAPQAKILWWDHPQNHFFYTFG